MPIVFIVAIIFFGTVWKISNALGAGFAVTLDAVMHTIPMILIGGLVFYFLRRAVLAILAGVMTASWPMWWPVVDSIACGGKEANSCFLPVIPWWDTSMAKIAVLAVLFGITVWLAIKSKPGY